MKFSKFEDLPGIDADIRNIVCIEQNWSGGHSRWSYLELPRPNDGLIYIRDGHAVYATDGGREIRANGGDILYLPRNSRYSVKFIHGDARSLLLNFRLFSRSEPLEISDEIFLVEHDRNDLFYRTFSDLCDLYASTANTLLIKARLTELLCRLASAKSSGDIHSAIRYMNNHLNTSKPIPEIAEMFAMSESTFRRKLRQETGLSPTQYLTGQKIEKAKHLLLIGELSVDNISEILAFYDSSHFVKFFKKHTGKTPAQYRREAAHKG